MDEKVQTGKNIEQLQKILKMIHFWKFLIAVLGPIEPGDMGLTLPHEHLSGDLGFALTSVPQEPKGMQTLPWTLENFGYIQQFP